MSKHSSKTECDFFPPRMEKLNLKVRSSQAKSIGTLVALAGAYFLIFYQGQAIVSTRSSSHSVLGTLFVSDWIIGGFLLVTSSVLFSLSFIVQVLVCAFKKIS